MKKTLLILSILNCILIFIIPVISSAQGNQTVVNGASTTAVHFGGAGCVYKWTNSNPAIGLPASGTGDISSFTAVNNGTSPIIATITATPEASDFAYIPNAASNTVSVINTLTNNIISTIPVGNYPFSVALSHDKSTVYIANSLDNTISVITTANNQVSGVITVGPSSDLYNTFGGIALSLDDSKLYVSNGDSNSITVIDTKTHSIISIIYVGFNPQGIVTSLDGQNIWVANSGSNTVSLIDQNTGIVNKTITVGAQPYGISVSPDGSFISVSNSGDNSISIIDSKTLTVKATVNVGLQPQGLSYSEDGKKLYVTIFSGVTVIDPVTASILNRVNFGYNLVGISISNDGSLLYVASQGDNNLYVVNTITNMVIATIAVGNEPFSFGTFLKDVTTCTNAVTFTITVNPSPPPAINFDATTLASLTTTYGTPSPSTSFTLSAMNLQGAVLVTPPTGFEVSTDNSSFSSTVSIGGTGILASTTIYIRLAAVTAVGQYSGNINLSSTGASDTNFGMANSEVNPALLTLTASNADKVYGSTLIGGSSPLAFSTNGLQNSETIGSVTVAYGTGAAATDPVNTYTGSVVIANATGGTFSPANYTIDYVPGNIIITPAPLIATVDNKSRVFGAINPVFTITYSGFVNGDNASVITVEPVITTTALTSSPAGQYLITASGATAHNYSFTYVPGILTITALEEEIVIPNAFTPNGDGINDLWDIKFLNLYPKCIVNVYTRYGEKVYSSVGYGSSWDGTYNGAQLPAGTYYYVIDPQSGSKILSGYITIIR